MPQLLDLARAAVALLRQHVLRDLRRSSGGQSRHDVHGDSQPSLPRSHTHQHHREGVWQERGGGRAQVRRQERHLRVVPHCRFGDDQVCARCRGVRQPGGEEDSRGASVLGSRAVPRRDGLGGAGRVERGLVPDAEPLSRRAPKANDPAHALRSPNHLLRLRGGEHRAFHSPRRGVVLSHAHRVPCRLVRNRHALRLGAAAARALPGGREPHPAVQEAIRRVRRPSRGVGSLRDRYRVRVRVRGVPERRRGVSLPHRRRRDRQQHAGDRVLRLHALPHRVPPPVLQEAHAAARGREHHRHRLVLSPPLPDARGVRRLPASLRLADHGPRARPPCAVVEPGEGSVRAGRLLRHQRARRPEEHLPHPVQPPAPGDHLAHGACFFFEQARRLFGQAIHRLVTVRRGEERGRRRVHAASVHGFRSLFRHEHAQRLLPPRDQAVLGVPHHALLRRGRWRVADGVAPLHGQDEPGVCHAHIPHDRRARGRGRRHDHPRVAGLFLLHRRDAASARSRHGRCYWDCRRRAGGEGKRRCLLSPVQAVRRHCDESGAEPRHGGVHA